jgi:3-hydroxybutyryl-CoA dehydrogenase
MKTQNLQIGVVGAGAMGRGIAQLFAQAGHQIHLFDVAPGASQAALKAVYAMWDSQFEKGKLPETQLASNKQHLDACTALADLAQCDLVIEAIIERLDIKQQLIADLENIVRPEAVIASNTSSLSITAMAASAKHPQRIAGFHFFNPVPLMRVVEVIQANQTAPEIVQGLCSLAQHAGHTAVVALDMPGFIVNHAGRGYGTEALKLLGEGVADIATVDQIMREQVQLAGLGFRMGPFELMDLTGLDVSHPVMESVYRQFYDEPRFRPSALAAQRVAGRVLGKKTRQGFYTYDANGKAVATGAQAQNAGDEAQGMASQEQGTGDLPSSVWIAAGETNAALAQFCEARGVLLKINPSDADLLIFTPEGPDLSQTIHHHQLQAYASKAVALDKFFDPFDAKAKRRTLMRCPATSAAVLEQAKQLFTSPGVTVSLIEDSPGFVAPRIVCMVVAIGCEIAQQGIASTGDIESAVKLGLGYPLGPLGMGDFVGSAKVARWLDGMFDCTGDPRYRPSLWLRRRAQLGLPLGTA